MNDLKFVIGWPGQVGTPRRGICGEAPTNHPGITARCLELKKSHA